MSYQSIRIVLYRKRLERKLKKKFGSGVPVTIVMKGRDVGFFSMFFQVIGTLHFCEKNKHNLKVDFVGGPYFEEGMGQNWWRYYFSKDHFVYSKDTRKQNRVLNEWEQKDFSYYGRELSSSVGHRLLDAFDIHETILRKVQDFKKERMDGHRVIGIHYRGTDKVSGAVKESNRISYEKVCTHLQKEKKALFFVATDEQAFLDHMVTVFADRVISYDAIRSNNSDSIHSGSLPGVSMYKAGEDALVDCLLLSSCARLIRTDSNLSYACRYFSPRQKCIIIGK